MRISDLLPRADERLTVAPPLWAPSGTRGAQGGRWRPKGAGGANPGLGQLRQPLLADGW
jgi:hypothetical protein